ncbi:BREX-1 system adenine-specific DNA-methyltransferase PglX [Aquirufa sp. ROCK2-A2]
MNTKTFAQQSRALLMEGVANKLLYWGFNKDGSVSEEPNPVAGGYVFRGKVFDDENVPKLWKSLQNAIEKKGGEVVKEEAAYTWFNRMMALQIMAKNDYLDSQLVYVPGMANTPQILQKARQGQYAFLNSEEQERLKRIITDFSKEQEAFALLLVGYCHSNKMLNNVFGKLDDYTELLLPDNMLQDSGFLHLLNTTDAITDEQYKEVELIGWLYQFYISERKDEVFASFKKKKKAEAKDIPAATQIFTPNWIVKYMVQNTVGKIWLDKNPNSKIKSSLKYLVESDTSIELIAGSDSTSEPIISEVSQLTLIDPAVGSGHILVEGFDLLYQMYMEEYYTPEEAVESILTNNLFGLDLDDRAAQLATFAILLKAAKQYRDVFIKGWLPNVYAMPEYAAFNDQEIKDFLGSEGIAYEKELKLALSLMEQSKNLGSTMKLSLNEDSRAFIEKRFDEIKNTDFRDINTEIVYQKIKIFIPVLLILSKKFASVVANPPYMGQGTMNARLKDYVNLNYPISKSDLFAIFMEVGLDMTVKKGLMGMINQHSWMFLSTYEKLREHILNNYGIVNMLHLGPRTFEELSGEVVQSTAFVLENCDKITHATFYRLVDYRNVKDKEIAFLNRKNEYLNIPQKNFISIPGGPIAYWTSVKVIDLFNRQKLGDVSPTKKGMVTLNDKMFIRFWWEPEVSFIDMKGLSRDQAINSDYKWFTVNKGGGNRKWYGFDYYLINWKNNGFDLKKYITETSGDHYSRQIFNEKYNFIESITWSNISSGVPNFRFSESGRMFCSSGPSAFPEQNLEYILALLNSKVAVTLLSFLSPTLSILPTQIREIPYLFEPSHITRIKFLCLENINISKNDWKKNEISKHFEKTKLTFNSKNIKDEYNSWQNSVKNDFFQLQANEEELNRLFIKIYGLQNELTPEVALKDITILQDELKKNDLDALEEKFRANGKDAIILPIDRGEVISQFISYAIGLFMGRYRLDKPGLNIAHPNPSKEELASYNYNQGEVIIDQDAILPIMGKNCNFNDDVVKQFTQLLDTIWGHEQRTENINFIQECLDKELEKFLVNDFWSYHCGMYKKTPIYWLFSSKKGAFQVLVYMHRMNEFTVEKIRANYLLEHLKYLKSEITQKEANASSLSTVEAKQLDKLRADLIECEQYDMALKNVADQQIKFDLDDGVAKNYELFETVVAKIK